MTERDRKTHALLAFLCAAGIILGIAGDAIFKLLGWAQ